LEIILSNIKALLHNIIVVMCDDQIMIFYFPVFQLKIHEAKEKIHRKSSLLCYHYMIIKYTAPQSMHPCTPTSSTCDVTTPGTCNHDTILSHLNADYHTTLKLLQSRIEHWWPGRHVYYATISLIPSRRWRHDMIFVWARVFFFFFWDMISTQIVTCLCRSQMK